MITVAIVGYGYWGKNLVRNFFNHSECVLHTVVDGDAAKLTPLQKQFPTVKTSTRYEDVLQNSSINAVVIATPVHSHYALAKAALLAGKHVLVEKPMTSTLREAEELIELALQRNLVIMPDHTFLYTGAVQKMKSMIDADEIGKIKYLDSTRINLGLFQSDVNVLWDLAPHDISICNYLVNKKPYSIQATGISHTGNDIENIAYLTMNFESDLIAHFNCSWTSPVKIRQMLIGGEKKMILFNDMEPTEKIKVYDTGYSVKSDDDKTRMLVDYRTGDIYVPKLPLHEALYAMATDFILAIRDGKKPVSNDLLGLEVVRILEASQQSIKQGGKEVKL
ncbi:MAG TPA: Gfo/Idh/MocA family oxidoreductase [Cyclobacteriaceae bacterium]